MLRQHNIKISFQYNLFFKYSNHSIFPEKYFYLKNNFENILESETGNPNYFDKDQEFGKICSRFFINSENHSMFSKNFWFTLFLALILISSQNFAQEETKIDSTIPFFLLDSLYFEMDDVVVTGTRVKKKIIDIPYSVYRLKRKKLSVRQKNWN